MGYYHRLDLLEPGLTDLCVRVKVLRKYYDYDDPTGVALTWFVFADEWGSRINANVDRECFDRYDNVLREGKWRTIKNFVVSIDGSACRPFVRAYKMILTASTKIYGSPQLSSSLFATFASFGDVIDGSIDTDILVELVGMVSRVGELINMENNPDDIDAYRLYFNLTDQIGQVIMCLLTDQLALDFADDYDNAGGGSVVCVLRWWRVYQVGPGSYGIRSERSVSQYIINHDIPEVQGIRMNQNQLF